VWLAAKGDRGVQLYDPPRLEHQYSVRVQDCVEPVWEKVVRVGDKDNALKERDDMFSLLVPPDCTVCPYRL
jgi:hypothetical protein